MRNGSEVIMAFNPEEKNFGLTVAEKAKKHIGTPYSKLHAFYAYR